MIRDYEQQHTLCAQVVRLLMHDTRRPPRRLGFFRIPSATRSRSCGALAAVVWMPHLLAWFDEFDERLRDPAAIELLEVLQSTLVVFDDLLRISNEKRRCLVTARRGDIAIRDQGIRDIGKVIIGGGSQSISSRAFDSTRRCY